MFEIFLEIFLDALKDSALILPVLFVSYLLIELLEEKILNKYKTTKFLKSRFAPAVSACFGLIPQCGFSVVAVDLYSQRSITIGSLFAILLATSDEAIPIMLANPNSYLDLLFILSIKFVYAVVVGVIFDSIFRKKINTNLNSKIQDHHIKGCCGHELEENNKNKIKEIFVHPLIHSLKIIFFIFVINIAFGIVLEFVGSDAIGNFMLSTGFFQPFLTALVGLIPNCGASVVITEIFLLKGISLGSCIAGLCVNSGIALVVLFRLNKNLKENIFILTSLYLLGTLLGVVVNLF